MKRAFEVPSSRATVARAMLGALAIVACAPAISGCYVEGSASTAASPAPPPPPPPQPVAVVEPAPPPPPVAVAQPAPPAPPPPARPAPPVAVVQPAPAPAAEIIVEAPPPAPPPPVEVAPPPPPPSPRHVWIAPYHRWDGRRYEVVRGHFEVRPHANARWVPAHWEARGRGKVWIDARWD